MHKIIHCVREILAADLPTVRDIDGTERPATDAELLNMGLQRLAGDIFSCCEQYRSDADDVVTEPDGRRARAWWPAHDDGPWATEAEKRSYPRSADQCCRLMGRGKLLTAGAARARFQQLEEPIRRQVMQARVVRSETVHVQDTVAAALEEQRQAFLEHVGEVRGDLDSDDAKRGEARRLARLASNDLAEVTVAEGNVLPGDLPLEAGLIPHTWSGER